MTPFEYPNWFIGIIARKLKLKNMRLGYIYDKLGVKSGVLYRRPSLQEHEPNILCNSRKDLERVLEVGMRIKDINDGFLIQP